MYNSVLKRQVIRFPVIVSSSLEARIYTPYFKETGIVYLFKLLCGNYQDVNVMKFN